MPTKVRRADGGRGRSVLARFVLCSLAVPVLAACHYDFDKSTIEQSGVGGVARLNDGAFAFAIFPCAEDRVSELELVVYGQPPTDTGYTLKKVVLRATFDPARSARELLISTSPTYVAPNGVVVEILDAATLDRFNRDEGYLTGTWSPAKDDFFAINAWDSNGESLHAGSYLHSRFDAAPGELVLTDGYVNGIDQVECSGEDDPAWHLPD